MAKIKIDLIGNDKGVGDTIHRAIKKVTKGKLKPCNGCDNRREWLNRNIPYKNPYKEMYE